VKSFVRALALAFCLSSAGPVFAHGEHGDAAPPAGASPVTVDGFQVELLTSPQPPRAGEQSRIIAKVVRSDTMEPVSGGKVSIGVARRTIRIDRRAQRPRRARHARPRIFIASGLGDDLGGKLHARARAGKTRRV
jgi:hypothetical protein